MIAQLGLFDAPAQPAAPVPGAPPLDPEAQAWLRSIGRTAEACERGDPARIAYELSIVEVLLDQGVVVNAEEFEDLCHYHHTARCDARDYGPPGMATRYEVLSLRLLRAHGRVNGWDTSGWEAHL
jgi:hypothetical protein